MPKNDSQKVFGCLMGFFSLLVCMPMQLILMFSVLQRVEAETWMWVLFWIYTPTIILLSCTRVFVDELLKDD